MLSRLLAMIRVPVQPHLLHWACERSGKDLPTIAGRFKHFGSWERGEQLPTLKQLEDFARFTRTPIGFLFLAEPPRDPVPIPDFRVMDGGTKRRLSADALESIYLCQQRQDWYRDFAVASGEERLPFVGSVRVGDDVVSVADSIRSALAFEVEDRRRMPTWTDALRSFIDAADAAGIMVMVSGVVGSNTSRVLDPEEFRGFALADDLAPLVFINGADTKAAQIFTLAHELAHVWSGVTALSDATPSRALGVPVERWCNLVAAELLVPMSLLRDEIGRSRDLRHEMDRLARRFKVSTLVILRRMHDAGFVDAATYRAVYEEELRRLTAIPRTSGGDFYRTLGARVSKRFAHAVVVSTLESRSSFTEAFRLLGFRKMATFRQLSSDLGVPM